MTETQQDERLKRTNIGTRGLFFQGLGQEAPIAIFIGSVTGAAAYALGATPLAFIIGLLASLLSGNSIYQISKHVAHAGGYAAYVNKGIGKHFATYTGYLFLLYQISGPAFICLIYFWTFSSSINAVFGTNISNMVGILFIAVALLVAFFIVYRGLRLSVSTLMVVGIVQFLVVFAFSAVFLVSPGPKTLAPFNAANALGGWHGVFLGFITGSYGAYAGYGSIVPLGEEVKAPHKSIGRAVLLIIIVMGITYLFATYAMEIAWGISKMDLFSQSGFPGAVLAGQYISVPAEGIVIGLYDAVIFTPLVSMITAGSRMFFSMSRQGLLPSFLSRVHKKHGTPAAATTFLVGVVTAVIILMGSIFWYEYGFETGIFFAWIILEIIWSLSTLIIHTLVNSSLSLIKGEGWSGWNSITRGVFPTVASIIIITAIAYAVYGITYPIELAPIALLIYTVLVLILMYIQRERVKEVKYAEVPASQME